MTKANFFSHRDKTGSHFWDSPHSFLNDISIPTHMNLPNRLVLYSLFDINDADILTACHKPVHKTTVTGRMAFSLLVYCTHMSVKPFQNRDGRNLGCNWKLTPFFSFNYNPYLCDIAAHKCENHRLGHAYKFSHKTSQ